MRIFASGLLLFLLTASQPPDLRQQLTTLIFGSFPTGQPSVETGITDPAYTDLPNLARIDRLTVTMEYGLTSVAYHFIPTVANRQLLIYHEGHWQEGFVTHKEFISVALERGFAVAAYDMPFYGHNSRPVVEIAGHNWTLTQHGQIEYLEPIEGHPLRYFLEPVIIGLNYFDTLDYSHTSMTGLSGGGWATTLVAALDSRIESSYPVAGSYPLWVRGDDWGDWEQNTRDIYGLADYDELYVLGASNGRQLQIINRYDTCCFNGLRWMAYYDDVRQRSGGKWDLWLDETHTGHVISEAAQAVIFGELAAYGAVRGAWLPSVLK